MMTTEPLATFLGACFIVLGFAVLFVLFRLPFHAQRVFVQTGTALTILGDPTIDDDSKEVGLQKVALGLAGTFFALLFLGAGTLAIPAGFIWLADRAGLLSFHDVLEATLDWRFLVGSTLVMSLAAWLYLRLLKKAPPAEDASAATTNADSYSATEQTLHQVAFASRPLQVALSRLEDRIAGRKVARTNAPVFIAALPRAGTTLLLELLENTGEFASHTYRTMPFVLVPLGWGRYMQRFGKADTAKERAHGDGMMVSVDSPEAFEEMLWMTFFPQRYIRPVVGTWKPQPNAKFEAFFARHRDKIVHLGRQGRRPGATRYVSKNNLNIARVDWLVDRIADARIVLPFREPFQHAASLLRQHRNFTKMHAEDPFSRIYMAGIGHFDFGANLKPVNFGRWRTENPDLDPNTLAFWLTYWCAAYEYLLKRQSERVVLFDFDAMCAAPAPALARLADFLGITDRDTLIAQGERIKTARAHETDLSAVPEPLLERVRATLAALKAASL